MQMLRVTGGLARWTGVLATAALIVVGTIQPAHAGTPPTISGFSPSNGPVGTGVTINGSNLLGSTSVRFNGTAARIQRERIREPDHDHGPERCHDRSDSVTTPNGTAQTGGNFVVSGSSGAPSITSFTPRNGPVGTHVTITGLRFTGVSSVRFNATGAAFTINGAGTQISTTVPSGATTGKVAVSGPSGSDQSYGDFTVTNATMPNISGFSPTEWQRGNGGHDERLGLTGATQVRFNGTVAPSFSVVNAGKITATVPSGATTGRISVTTAAGTDSSNGNFTVTGQGSRASPPPAAPRGRR